MYLPRSLALVSRSSCNNYGYSTYGGSYNNCSSSFSRWGRWVVAGVLIFAALFILLVATFCMRRRRRRRNNLTTGPAMSSQSAGNYQTGGYGNNQYENNQAGGYGNQQYSAPSGPPPTEYGGANSDYYGQQSGVAQPGQTYQPYKG